MTVDRAYRPRRRSTTRTVSISKALDVELQRIAAYEHLTVSKIVSEVCTEFAARWKAKHPELEL